MKTLLIHLGLSLFLICTAVPAGECTVLGKLVEGIWLRFERLWDASHLQFLKGPLKFLDKLPGLQLARTVIRFAISTVVKLPFKATLNAFDFVCDTLMKEGIIGKSGLIKAEDLSLTFFDDEGSDKIPLPSLQKMFDSPRFVPNQILIIFIPSWTQANSEPDSTTTELINCFNQHPNNFAVMNLGESMDNLYTWSAYNAQEVGHILGIHLSKLSKVMPPENIHIIGAGLGAQIAGCAGKKVQLRTGTKIGRITGLDPSRPCFGNSGLDKTSAKFVDIIHSSKLFGSFETKGHVDFYTNRISTVLPLEGCTSFMCLHQRAVLYYAESVLPGQEGQFCGVACESRNRFELGNCKGNEEIFMGHVTTTDARGSYYLNTNLQSPYGQCKTPLSTTDEPIPTTDAANVTPLSTTDEPIPTNDAGNVTPLLTNDEPIPTPDAGNVETSPDVVTTEASE